MLSLKLLKQSFKFQQIIIKNNSLLFQRKKDFNILRFSSSDTNSYDELGFLFENSSKVVKIPEAPAMVLNDDKIPETPTMVLDGDSFVAYGLNNYTPTGLVQFILENVHNTMDIPWWGCIVLTAVFLKTVTAPLLIKQRKHTVKFQNCLNTMSKIGSEALDAHRSGNSLLMNQKMMVLHNMSDQDVLKSKNFFIPILIQTPIFISVFTALKGMVDVNLPSLKNEGLWWFQDLIAYDPYYILPLIAGSSISLIMESNLTKESHIAMKVGLRLIGPMIFIFFCHMPSTLVLYWSVSNTYSLIFALILKLRNVQEALKIPVILPVSERTKQFGYDENKELFNVQREMIAKQFAEQKEILMQQKGGYYERKRYLTERNKRIEDEYERYHKAKIKVTGEIVENEKSEIK